MTATTTRVAVAVVLVVAASASTRTSSADDAAESPQPLALRLAAGATYVYRYVQDATLRVASKELRLPGAAFAAGDDGSLGAQSSLRIEWQVGLKLVEVRADESVVVSLLPLRASGSASFAGVTSTPPGVRVEPGPTTKFDSDDVDRPSPSPFVGRAIVVKLSPDARVLEATPAPLAPTRVESISRAAALEFAQRFFQELPTTPPRAKTAWDSRRALAPELGVVQVGRVDLGEVVETATVAKCDALVVAATIRGKAATATPVSGPPVAGVLSPWRTKVLAADVVGEATIARATGLARTRGTHVVVKAHRDEVTLAGGTFVDGGLIPHRVELPKSLPAQDETYEIETRLELMDAR
jgi:hypothetical protein